MVLVLTHADRDDIIATFSRVGISATGIPGIWKNSSDEIELKNLIMQSSLNV